MSVKIERIGNFWIRVSENDDGMIDSQGVEANLLYAILQELKKIMCV